MTRQDLIDTLLVEIEKATAEERDTIPVPVGLASDIMMLLTRIREDPQPWITEEGEVVFYCAECGQSFRAVPREDPECFARWKYHRWFASCPRCRSEVMQNDRYWR